jgi:nicotinate-nucleotide adenylyltransferase
MCAAKSAASDTKREPWVPHPSPRRVGVMGGMFDPIHLGHLQAAARVRQKLALDAVLLVPCGNPVHRGKAFASADERCAMVALAIEQEPWLQLDLREAHSAAPSYTFDTLAALHAEQPAVSWQLLLGIDAFLTLPAWKQWLQLLVMANLVVMTRPGYQLREAAMPLELLAEWSERRVADAAAFQQCQQGAILCLDVQSAALSSTQVRHLVKTGADLGPILHPAVAAHIRRRGLYQSGEPA